MDLNTLAARIAEETTAEEPSFEELATSFWQETGVVAPGVAIPPPLTDRWGEEVRRQRWAQWQEDRKTGRPSRSIQAARLGRQGGLKGGKARAAALSAERRSEIARQAARARWSKRSDSDER